MCVLKLRSKVDYFGLLYQVTRISKKEITLSGFENKSLVCEIRPSLVIRELANQNLKVLEV